MQGHIRIVGVYFGVKFNHKVNKGLRKNSLLLKPLLDDLIWFKVLCKPVFVDDFQKMKAFGHIPLVVIKTMGIEVSCKCI